MKQLARFTTLAALLVAASSAHADPTEVILFKNPQCSCCEGYADYLRQNGFTVATPASSTAMSSMGTARSPRLENSYWRNRGSPE